MTTTLYKQARQASARLSELLARREEITKLIFEENEVKNALQKRLMELDAMKNLLHPSERGHLLTEETDCHKQLSELVAREEELQQIMLSLEAEITKVEDNKRMFNSVRLTTPRPIVLQASQEPILTDPKTPLSELMTSKEKMESRLALPSQSKIAMQKLEDRVNRDLGYNWWKKYISAAFWSNLSTPINICITFFTALTTGQTATSNLLSTQAVIGLGLVTLVLSTLNTFFTPHKKMVSHMEEMNKWQEVGSQFESVYYSNNFDEDDFERKFKAYEDIQKSIHQLKIKQQTTDADFLTDLIHLCAVKTCLNREKWIDEEKSTDNPVSETSV